MAPSPYEILGLPGPQATDAEVRSAYRRAVQQHHPDHNGGSAASARRFEAVQEAYAQIRSLRASAPPSPTPAAGPPSAGTPTAPGIEDRLAALERELRQERELALRQARRAAAEAAATDRARPSAEELGYVDTEDSFGRILDDAVEALRRRLAPEPE